MDERLKEGLEESKKESEEERLKKLIAIEEKRLRKLEESRPQQRTSKEQLYELWGFKTNLDSLTHEQLKHALIASDREERYEYVRYLKERVKRLQLELQLKEAQKLSLGVAKLSSEDVLIEAVRKYLQNSKRKAIDKRRVCKEIVQEFVKANKLTLPEEVDEMLDHLDDQEEGDVVNLTIVGQPAPQQSQKKEVKESPSGEIEVPECLKTPEAEEIWALLREAGFIVEDGYALAQGVSNNTATYIADLMGDALKITPRWKPFQDLWEIKNMAQHKNKWHETGITPPRSKEIDALFEALT